MLCLSWSCITVSLKKACICYVILYPRSEGEGHIMGYIFLYHSDATFLFNVDFAYLHIHISAGVLLVSIGSRYLVFVYEANIIHRNWKLLTKITNAKFTFTVYNMHTQYKYTTVINWKEKSKGFYLDYKNHSTIHLCHEFFCKTQSRSILTVKMFTCYNWYTGASWPPFFCTRRSLLPMWKIHCLRCSRRWC